VIGTAVRNEAKRSWGELKQAYNTPNDLTGKNILSAVDHTLYAIPGIGGMLQTSQEQSKAGNTAGALGTMAGLVGSGAVPKLGAKVLGSIGSGIGSVAQGIGKASEVAGASADSLKLAGTRILAPGNAGQVLSKALKPGVAYGADTPTLFNDVMPAVNAINRTPSGIGQMVDATDAARNAQFRTYDDMVAPYRLPAGGVGPIRSAAVNGGPIAEAQMRSIPLMDRIEQPGSPVPFVGGVKGGIVQKTADVASGYRRDLGVPALDTIREEANAKLNAFYNKSGGDRNAALSNPETARVKAVGDTTRDLLYNQLGKDAGVDPAAIAAGQQMYGKLSDVGDIAGKRETVFGRHDPVSLAEKVVAGHGGPIASVWNFAMQKGLKGLTDSDALVRSAFDRYNNPLSTPLVPNDNPFLGAVNSAGKGVSGVGTQATLLGNKIARSTPDFRLGYVLPRSNDQ
jgi:hypothetical protein